MKTTDELFMRRALTLARRAERAGEVPVGAVVVCKGEIVGSGTNGMEAQRSVLAHAELRALAAASRRLDNWRLTGCEVFVTLEPCPMCAAALCLARVSRIVYGAPDPLAGACGSVYDLPGDGALKSRPRVTPGIEQEKCTELLRSFFRRRRG